VEAPSSAQERLGKMKNSASASVTISSMSFVIFMIAISSYALPPYLHA
jgi:hypothetical protein